MIIVLADTLRADHVGSYGYERATTPALDALAARSVLFERAVSQASCTFPSVNSMLTSRYPQAFLRHRAGELGIPEHIPSLAEVLAGRGFETVAVSASPIVRKSPSRFNEMGGFDRGFDVFDESCQWRSARCVNNAALKHLPDGEAPFFLYLHYMDPHDPYRPLPAFQGRFSGPYRGEHEFIAEGNPNPIAKMLSGGGPELEISDADLHHLIALYDEAIASFDAHLGALLAKLDQRGLLDDTLLIVLSDHGEHFLEHGQIKHCRRVSENEIKVPLILSGAGLSAGRRVSEVVEGLDVVPTILDYLGIEPRPGSPECRMEGSSLRALIEGRERSGSDGLDALGFTWQARWRSVTGRRFKLVRRPNLTFELFDLQTDPGETRDVLRQNRHDFAVLREALIAWRRRMESSYAVDRDRRLDEDFEEKMRSIGYVN